jgi:hypothetical protein
MIHMDSAELMAAAKSGDFSPEDTARLINESGHRSDAEHDWSIISGTGTGIGIALDWAMPLPPVFTAGKFAARSARIGGIAKGGGGALVRMEDEVFNTALFQDATKTFDNVAGFKIYGNKGMIGDEFTRNIFLIEAEKQGQTPLRTLLNSLEPEARAAGAKSLNIGGDSVINDGFLNPRILQRYGFQFERINEKTVRLWKSLE